MTKWASFGIALSLLLLSGQAAAGQRGDTAGRYQVIPDAVVPGKNGQLEKRTLLLDSVTGLTWVITRHPKSGKGADPLWSPIETKSVTVTAAPPAPAEKPKAVQSKPSEPEPEPAASSHSNRLDRRFSNYDSNP